MSKIYTLENIFLLITLSLLTFNNNSFAYDATDLTKLLPAQKDIAPWLPNGEVSVYKGTQLYDYINGGAEIFYEYGFEAALAQEYNSGEQSLVVEFYSMTDAAAAFGIYSINRDPLQSKQDIGNDATLFDYHLAFWQGKYYIVIMGYEKNDKTHEALVLFAQHISKKITIQGTPPAFLNKLPNEYMLKRSERWLEGILSVNGIYYFGEENIWNAGVENTEIVAADYKKDEITTTLILAQYGTPTDAQTVFEQIRKILNEKVKPEKSSTSGFKKWIDSKKRVFLVGCNDSQVAIAVRASDEDFAKKIVESALANP